MPLELKACWIIRAPPLQFQTQTHMPETLPLRRGCVPASRSCSAKYLHVYLEHWASLMADAPAFLGPVASQPGDPPGQAERASVS